MSSFSAGFRNHSASLSGDERLRHRPWRWMCFVVLLVLLVLAWTGAWRRCDAGMASRWRCSVQLDHGEGLMLGLWRMKHLGRPLYSPFQEQPWVVNNYPPLYLFCVAALADRVEEALSVGRRISAAALGWLLAMVVLMVAGARRGGEGSPEMMDWLAGLTAAGLLAFLPGVQHWGSLMRVDMLGLALSGTGLALVCMANRRQTWPVVVAAVFFCLALSTKHSLAAGPLAVALSCLPHRRRRFWRFSLGLALALTGGLIWGWLATDGEMVNHLVQANRTAWSWELSRHHLGEVWSQVGWLMAPACCGVLLSLAVFCAEYKQKGRTPRFVLATYLGLTALGLLLTGKSGSSSNYYLEFYLALALQVGLLLGDLAALPRVHGGTRRLLRLPFLILFLCVVPLVPLLQPGFMDRAIRIQPELLPNREAREGLGLLVKHLKGVDGPILTQDMSLAPLADHDLIYHPFMMPDLARRGLWRDAQLIEMLERKSIPIVILSFDLADKERWRQEVQTFGAMFTADTLVSIRDNYRLERVLPLLPTRRQLVIYRPRM